MASWRQISASWSRLDINPSWRAASWKVWCTSHCEIGGPPSFWQETVEKAVLRQKVHPSMGELNAGYKLQNSFLDWRSGQVRRHLYQHHRRLDGHRHNTESDSRYKSIGHVNCRPGDRNIFQEGLGYQSFPKRHWAQISIRFFVQGDKSKNMNSWFYVVSPISTNVKEAFWDG
jgi:hypothetical protein